MDRFRQALVAFRNPHSTEDLVLPEDGGYPVDPRASVSYQNENFSTNPKLEEFRMLVGSKSLVFTQIIFWRNKRYYTQKSTLANAVS